MGVDMDTGDQYTWMRLGATGFSGYLHVFARLFGSVRVAKNIG